MLKGTMSLNAGSGELLVLAVLKTSTIGHLWRLEITSTKSLIHDMNTELATKCVGESEGGGDLFMMLWPARYLLLMSADGSTRAGVRALLGRGGQHQSHRGASTAGGIQTVTVRRYTDRLHSPLQPQTFWSIMRILYKQWEQHSYYYPPPQIWGELPGLTSLLDWVITSEDSKTRGCLASPVQLLQW